MSQIIAEAQSDLVIGLVQSVLFWEDPTKNCLHFTQLITQSQKKADVWILPEMCTTGFSMKTQHALLPEVVLEWMIPIAKNTDAAICGSVMVADKGFFFNRFFWVEPDGGYYFYDKRHMFRMAGEHEVFTGGKSQVVFSFRGWKIMPQICYDLRFPVWSRNRLETGEYAYDLLIYVANWPEKRRDAWKALLPARAVENQAYVAGLNRVGTDGYGIDYAGDSAVFGFLGNALLPFLDGSESVELISLSRTELMSYRKAFPAMMDADDFSLIKS
jgi:omega-amidase